ncbi:hypothetical protein [Desulfonatronum thiodismutans]|uniref:hypothetical protein n=1 Tax=Desulfonatronum thiodismutans TaxID=159290 RepID=UPI0004ABE20B|nr:hypothetical protein [Desulfonatronum thiodismutans]
MSEFDFISNDTFRNMLERDKREMASCLEAGNFKSVLILSGSIIEAILVDFFLVFLNDKHSSSAILKSPLSKLIDIAAENSLVSDRTKDIATVVRNYRNLIHPGIEFRLKEKVDKPSAVVATNLVDIMIAELRDVFSEKYGYRADAVIAKVKIDPTCSTIFKHMVSQMIPSEKLKLFCSIPIICENVELEDDFINFVKLHGVIAETIPQNVIKKETEKLNEYLKHKSMEDIFSYLTFYIKHLNLLENRDRDAVLAYLFGQLCIGNRFVLMDIKRMNPYTIGKFIDNDNRIHLLREAIFKRLHQKDTDGDDLFLSILEGVFVNLSDDVKENIKERIVFNQTQKSLEWIKRINNFCPF